MWYVAAFFLGVGATLAVITIVYQASISSPPPPRRPVARPLPPRTPQPNDIQAAEVTRVRLIYRDGSDERI